MARIHWKQPISITLSKDVLKIIREAAKKDSLSRSAIVEMAVLYWKARQSKGEGGTQC